MRLLDAVGVLGLDERSHVRLGPRLLLLFLDRRGETREQRGLQAHSWGHEARPLLRLERLRDLDAVTALAAECGLTAAGLIAMPANNLSVLFRRSAI